MSRSSSRTTTLVAGAAGVLVLGGLLGLGMLGDDDATPAGSSESATSESPTEAPAGHGGDQPAGKPAQDLPDLDEGFEAVAADKIFSTIADAQREAGSWEVSSLVVNNGEETPVVRQQLSYHDGGADFRIQMPVDEKQVADGVVEGLYVDEAFYLKGLNPARWDESWYEVPNDDEILRTFEATLQSTSAANLASYGAPSSYEVVGLEDVTELDDDVVRVVHYRLELDPSAAMGAQAAEGEMLVMDLWVDVENRPVQVESVITSGGEEYRSALYYSDYGADFEMTAPDATDRTDRRPPSMRTAD